MHTSPQIIIDKVIALLMLVQTATLVCYATFGWISSTTVSLVMSIVLLIALLIMFLKKTVLKKKIESVDSQKIGEKKQNFSIANLISVTCFGANFMIFIACALASF